MELKITVSRMKGQEAKEQLEEVKLVEHEI